MKKQKRLHRLYNGLCMIIITLIVLSFAALLIFTYQSLLNNTEQLLQTAHSQSYTNIQDYFDRLEDAFTSMSYNASMQAYLKEPDPIVRYSYFQKVQSVFSSIRLMERNALGFAIYNSDGDFLTANGSNYRAVIMTDNISPPFDHYYYSFYPPNRYIGITSPYFAMSVPVLDLNSGGLGGETLGVILLTIDQSYLRAQLEAGEMLDSGGMYLLDENDFPLAGSGVVLPSEITAENREKYIIFESGFDNNGWRIVSLMETGSISEEMLPVWQIIFLTAVLIVVIILGFMFTFRSRILRPIMGIGRHMHKVAETALSSAHDTSMHYHLERKNQYSEFVIMNDSMNLMLDVLHEKTALLLQKEKQYYEEVLAKERMEIMAYRNQINPHFLHNTLECIRGIAISRKVPEIVAISQALSQMFRYAVRDGNFSSVSMELEHLEKYATIIRYRFMGRISIKTSAREEVLSYPVPRLILQPLVENAVFHGLEQKTEQGSILVEIFLSDTYIHIRVQDDGVGIDQQTLEELKSKLISGDFSGAGADGGIGLINIAHRLRLFYGKDTELRLSSDKSGTVADITIPAGEERRICIGR